MKTLEFNYDLENGFAFIVVEGGKYNSTSTIQCCLESSGKGLSSGEPYLTNIKKSDCGHNEGICADINESAFGFWGETRCMSALFSSAKAADFLVTD